MSNQSASDVNQILLQQYTQCRFDIRNFDSMIWQIPTASSAINGAVVAYILNNKVAGGSSIFASFFLFVLTIPLTLALIKNRFFQMSRVKTAKNIMKILSAGALEDYATKTSEVQERESSPTNCVWRWRLHALQTKFWNESAYYVLFFVMLISHLLQLLLCIASVVNTLL